MKMKYLNIIGSGMMMLLLLPVVVNAEWDEGVTCFKAKDYVCAAVRFKEVIKLNPKHYAGYYMLGLTQIEMKNTAEAENNLRKAVEFSPNDFGSCYQLALIVMQKKDNDRSEVVHLIEQGLSAVKNDQDKALALRVKGAAYLALKKFDRAQKDLEAVLQLLPNDETAMYLYGITELELKQYDIAFEYLNKTCGKKPVNEENVLALIQAANGSKNYARAKEIGEAFMQKSTKNPEILSNLGLTYLALKDYKKAAAMFKQLPENYSDKNYNLAQAYVAMEDWENSLKVLETWEKKDPDNVIVLRLLGRVYLSKVPIDPQAAMWKYKRAYELTNDPKDQEMYNIAEQKYIEYLKEPENKNNRKE